MILLEFFHPHKRTPHTTREYDDSWKHVSDAETGADVIFYCIPISYEHSIPGCYAAIDYRYTSIRRGDLVRVFDVDLNFVKWFKVVPVIGSVGAFGVQAYYGRKG